MADVSSPTKKKARKEPNGKSLAVYPGEEGSLAHTAATQFFQNVPGITLNGVDTFAEMFKEVSGGHALYGVVPIENSASGAIHCVYDLAAEHDIQIAGELGVREVYCICAKSPTSGLGGIRRLLSHANILEACSTFIKTRLVPAARSENAGVESRAMRSTTEAARRLAEGGADAPFGSSGAIMTKQTAAKFGLTVLAEDIGNDAFLETRYILIHKRGSTAAERAPLPFTRDAVDPIRKRSAVFILRNEPGAMYKLLSCWALRGIDVLKVETRPMHGHHNNPDGLPLGTARLWDYYFFVEYAVPSGQTTEADKRLQDALTEFSLWSRDFGTYPSLVSLGEKKAQSWEEMVDLMAKA